MKKTSKKVLSLVLSALMVITMLPTFAITALADEWIAAASSNLANSNWSQDDEVNWNWCMPAHTNEAAPNTDAGGSQLNWRLAQYYAWANDWDASPQVLINNGQVKNGYLYLDGSTTPITGADSFKIDVQFRFTDNFEITNNGGTTSGGADFLILTTHNDCTWFNGDAKSNYAFKQSGYGNVSFNPGAPSDDSRTSM